MASLPKGLERNSIRRKKRSKWNTFGGTFLLCLHWRELYFVCYRENTSRPGLV